MCIPNLAESHGQRKSSTELAPRPWNSFDRFCRHRRRGKSFALGRRVRVVAGAMADVEGIGGGPGDGYLHAMKARSFHLVVRIIPEQVLRSQVVADARKGLVQPSFADVEALTAGLLGQGDERMFAAQVAVALASMGTSMML